MTQREQDLEEKLAQALARIAQLEALVNKLKAIIGRNSRNSSKPPSSDSSKPRKAPTKSTGAPRGGQPGHPAHQRQHVSANQIDQVIDLIPSHCSACQLALAGFDENPLIHQVVEVPPIIATVTEYRRHALTCSACQARTRQDLPLGVNRGSFGARLSAMMTIASAKYRLSKRLVKEMMSDFLGVSLCIGSVAKTEQRVSAALAGAYQQAVAHVRSQPVVHADETGWREDKSRAWLWVAATRLVSVFHIALGRGRRAAQHLLGESFSGILVTDRWSAYTFVPSKRRQLCWAHLLRDFQAWIDRDTPNSVQGRQMLKLAEMMFSRWHRVRDKKLSRRRFKLQMAPLRAKMLRVLRRARHGPCVQTAGSANHILKLQKSLWNFVDHNGVEPTNNFAERTIRHGVIWRKLSFGTDTLRGSFFVERMLTAVNSLRQQERNVLEFVAASLRANWARQSGPSLLPGCSDATQKAA